jgi:hypothetical protein
MKRILLVLGILAVFIISAVPAYAAMPNPDNPPTITRINVFRNLLQSGDMLYVWEANIPYATTPDYKVGDAFVWQLLNGATVLGSNTGFAYHDDGYNYNVYSMYFSAATVTVKGMVWNTAYILRLSGSPAAFTTPPSYNYAVSGYTTYTSQADNQAALADEIILIASDLNVRWSLTTDYYLSSEIETGTVLSGYGETVFRGAIYGVQAFAPAAFSYVLNDLEVTDRAWGSNYTTNLSNQYSGTWIETARNASMTFLGTTYDLTSLIILLIACVVIAIGNLALTSDHWNALTDVAFLLVIASRIDVLPLVYLALIAAIAFIYLGMRVWKMIPSG